MRFGHGITISNVVQRPLGWLLPLLAVVLLAAGPAAADTGKDPDGGYSGKLTNPSSEDGDVTFDVRKNGRLIDDFETVVVAVCVNPNAIGGIEVVPVAVTLERVAVKRNGRFSTLVEGDVGGSVDGTQSYELEGKLKGNSVGGGSIALDGICDSENDFTAKRRN